MHHVAIMKKSWGLTEKIISGEKKIESRWYKTKHAPWGNIKMGDTVYFKNSGESVSVKARVSKVVCFENLNKKKIKNILNKYGKDDGIEKNKLSYFYHLFKDKKYCILIFLKKAKVIWPFDINKKGFGMMSAWIATESITNVII